MKIQTIVQFYLDAMLPRDPSWQGWGGVRLEAPTFVAWVSPWDPSVEALYPTEIDRGLSETFLILASVDFPGGAIRKSVGDSAVDRIRVVLEWDDAEAADLPLFDSELALGRAIDAANKVIDHIRSSAFAPWVPRVRRLWRPQDGNFYTMTPWTMSVFDLDTGARLPVFGGANGASSTGEMRAPVTGTVSVASIVESMQASLEPPLHLTLLLEAEAKIESMALREAILDLASACEVAATTYINNVAGGEAEKYRKRLSGVKGKSFAWKYYKSAPLKYSLQSLEQVDPLAYSQVEDMYRERNTLMHRGQMGEVLGSLPSRDLLRTVHGYLSAAHRAVEWISSLT